MSVSFVGEEILVVLEDLITQRAERGNAQSKHGLEAAMQFELWKLGEMLDRLMTQEQSK